MSGVTSTGFDRKTFETIKTEIVAELKRTIDARLVLDASTPLGQMVDTCANQIAEAWEAIEDAYHGFDPDNAVGLSMVALAKLTGTQRRAPTRGSVAATVNLDGGTTYAAETLVAHEDGNTDNRWYNLNDITTPSVGAADYSATFVSEEFGSTATVGAGDLSGIAETVSGWNSITNATAATAGEDLETIEELRLRREDELAASGDNTLGAIVAEVSAVENILDVVGFENKTATTVGSIGPHGFRVVVWDDSLASDNAIAQAIHDTRPAGIQSYGSESGTATSWDGSSEGEAFDRATEKVVEVNVVIVGTADASEIRQKIMAAFGTVNASKTKSRKQIGDDAIYNALISAPFEVDGVTDVTTFQIRFNGDAWGTSNLAVGTDEIATMIPADITVS